MPRSTRRGATVVALAVTLTACATGGPDVTTRTDSGIADSSAETTATEDIEATTGPSGPTPEDSPADGADPTAARVTLATVADGFEQPNAVVVTANDDLWVAEQPGRVTTIEGDVLLDISGQTAFGGERGLLDIVLHPDGTRLFVHHSGRDGQTLLAEYTLTDEGIDADSRVELFQAPQPAANHNGGSLVFLPDDTLLLALGDGGRSGDAFDQAQDTSTPLGGLLRFDVSDPGVAAPTGAGFDEPALWVYGLRNPWRVAIDDGVLYVADVGQDAVEEVSFVPLDRAAGANFGWPFVEGDQCFAEDPCDGDFIPSVVNLEHRDEGGACSITGGIVYRGSAIPDLVGTYLYSDLCLGNLEGIKVQDAQVAARVDLTDQVDVTQVVGFGSDADGELLIIQLSGEILRLEPA